MFPYLLMASCAIAAAYGAMACKNSGYLVCLKAILWATGRVLQPFIGGALDVWKAFLLEARGFETGCCRSAGSCQRRRRQELLVAEYLWRGVVAYWHRKSGNSQALKKPVSVLS